MARIVVDDSNPNDPVYYYENDTGQRVRLTDEQVQQYQNSQSGRKPPSQANQAGNALGQIAGNEGAELLADQFSSGADAVSTGTGAVAGASNVGATGVQTVGDGVVLLDNGNTVTQVGTSVNGGTMLSDGNVMMSDGTVVAGPESSSWTGDIATYLAMAVEAYKAATALGNSDMSGKERAQEAERRIGLAVADYFTGGLASMGYGAAEQFGGETFKDFQKIADGANVMHHVWGELGQGVFGRRNDHAKSIARWQQAIKDKGVGDRWAIEANKIINNSAGADKATNPNWNKWTEQNDPTGRFIGQDYSWEAQKAMAEQTGNFDSFMMSLGHAEAFGDKWHDISLEKRREFMRRAYEEGLYTKDGAEIILGERNGNMERAKQLMNEIAGGDINQMTPEELGSLQAPDFRYEVVPQPPVTPTMPTATGAVNPSTAIPPQTAPNGAVPTGGIQKPVATTGGQQPVSTEVVTVESPMQIPTAYGQVALPPEQVPTTPATVAPNLGVPTKYADRGRILWKPYSDSDGNLAVLLPRDPGGAVIRDKTTGEILGTGRGIGQGNGFQQTYRFDKPGSSYSNAVLELADGTTMEVGDGSLRYENQGTGKPGEQITATGGFVPPPPSMEADMKKQMAMSLAMGMMPQVTAPTALSDEMDGRQRSAQVSKLIDPIVQGLAG